MSTPTPAADREAIEQTVRANLDAWMQEREKKAEPDGRVIFQPDTVADLTKFLLHIERQVAWIRGLLVTQGDMRKVREHLDTPVMQEVIAKLRAESALPTPSTDAPPATEVAGAKLCKHGEPMPCRLGIPGCLCADDASQRDDFDAENITPAPPDWEPEPTDADILAVEQAVETGHGAWDMVKASDIIRAAWKIKPPIISTREAERVPPTGEAPVAWAFWHIDTDMLAAAIPTEPRGEYPGFVIRPLYLHPPVVAQQEGQP